MRIEDVLPLPPEHTPDPAAELKHLRGLQARANRAMARAQRKMGYGGYAGMAARGRYDSALREWKQAQVAIERLERGDVS